MPLPKAAQRKLIHERTISMRAYARDDGLFDIEGHLVDTKPFSFKRFSQPAPVPAGEPLHDLWVRLTVDAQYVVRDVEAATDATPWTVCHEASATLRAMVGERIAGGWSSKVKERLRGSASCTHLMEMLLPMASTALQGIRGVATEKHIFSERDGVPVQLNSCYAYAEHTEVVKRVWPAHHRPRPTGAD